jgi:plasmid maintenance system antidote protein VapI
VGIGSSVSCATISASSTWRRDLRPVVDLFDAEPLIGLRSRDTDRACGACRSGCNGAFELHRPANRLTDIVRGKRSISAETTLRLGRYLATGGTLRVNLQAQHDLAVAERDHAAQIAWEMAAKQRLTPVTRRAMRRSEAAAQRGQRARA